MGGKEDITEYQVCENCLFWDRFFDEEVPQVWGICGKDAYPKGHSRLENYTCEYWEDQLDY